MEHACVCVCVCVCVSWTVRERVGLYIPSSELSVGLWPIRQQWTTTRGGREEEGREGGRGRGRLSTMSESVMHAFH